MTWLSDDWPTSTVGRLFDIRGGTTPAANEDNWGGDIDWATPVDLRPVHGGVLNETARTLSAVGASSVGLAPAPPGSIVLSCRAPIGYVAVASRAMSTNQGCKTLVPREEVDARFFRYQLEAFRPALEARGRGSTFIEVSSQKVAEFPVAVPPVEVQRRVAEMLDAETTRINTLIAKNNRVFELLHVREQVRRERAISALPTSPLGYYLTGLTQGTSPDTGNMTAGDDEEGVLRLSAVRQGQYDPGESKLLDEAASKRLEGAVVAKPGTVLVSRANTPDRVGDAALVDAELPGQRFVPDLMFALTTDDRLLPAFLTMNLLTRRVRDQIEAVARGSSQSMVKLRQDDVRGLRVPTCDVAMQRQLIATDRAASERAALLCERVTEQEVLLHTRRQALITAAVTGQIEV